jgi:hypothetical protein
MRVRVCVNLDDFPLQMSVVLVTHAQDRGQCSIAETKPNARWQLASKDKLIGTGVRNTVLGKGGDQTCEEMERNMERNMVSCEET